MYRSKTCGELRLQDAGSVVTLAGWVQRSRKMGGMTFVDLRDRYGLTQLVFNEADDAELCERANKLGREFCIQVKGEVSERQSKNPKMPTGDIEILVKELNVLSESLTPPFTIEDNTDGGDDIRMKYRYLDLRRAAVRKNLELRHRMTILIRNFLDGKDFIEVETPILIATEATHSFVPCHALQWRKLNATYLLKQVAGHILEELQYILLINKRHLAVDLSELRLTVSTQVLITETLCNLEVTVETRYHQQLLKCLWRLRQCIELTRIHT